MKKLKVIWNPDMSQDFDSLTNPNSPFYDKNYKNRILKKYGSLKNFKKSSDWKKLLNKYYGIKN